MVFSNMSIFAEASQADSTIKAVKRDGEAIGKDLDKSKQKIMMIWTYGNQLVNLLLRTAATAFEGTKAAAGIQMAIAGVQIAQAESAVFLTTKQSLAAFTSGNIGQGIILATIALALQSNIVAGIMNKEAARQAAAQAERYRLQIEAYRS